MARAGVVITEVMYNPPGSDVGREWIEIYNNADQSIELTSGQKGWKVSDGSNHVLGSTLVLEPGAFAILASNPNALVPQYGSNTHVVKTALNLNNTGATLSIINAQGGVVDTVSYTKNQGGFEDGMSLHRVGDTFAPGVPGPGLPPNTGMPKAVTPKTNPIPPAVKKETVQAPAPVAARQAAAVAVHPLAQASTTKEYAPVPAAPAALWHYLVGLAALVLFGVASALYIRAEHNAQQKETSSVAEEFDIE